MPKSIENRQILQSFNENVISSRSHKNSKLKIEIINKKYKFKYKTDKIHLEWMY